MPLLLTFKNTKDKNCFQALKLCHMTLKVIINYQFKPF